MPTSSPHSKEAGFAHITTKRLEQREVPCPGKVRHTRTTQNWDTTLGGWGGEGGLRLINFSSTTHHIDIVSLFVSSCGSNRFILQTIPCSVDRRMDCRLHSCCLLRLHFCLGIWFLFKMYDMLKCNTAILYVFIDVFKCEYFWISCECQWLVSQSDFQPTTLTQTELSQKMHRPASPKTMICCDLADPLIFPFSATTRSWFQLKTEMVGWT